MPDSRPWAAVLAGGDGRRLQAFTKSLAGDSRPKQFCPLFGGRTLLEDTRRRLSRNVDSARTLYVVTRAHEQYYRRVLQDVPPGQLVQQPARRGTTVAVAAALARLRRLGVDGTVGIFPSDHYYRDAAVLQRTVAAAYWLAAASPDLVVLLGAEATRPETEYGWIEPGEPIPLGHTPASGADLWTVRRFREKPDASQALDLLARGGLWNTLVVIGHQRAFESLLATAVPEVWSLLGGTRSTTLAVDEALAAAYAALPTSDFSRDVLSVCPDRLAVIRMGECGWTDLGQPHRVLDVLAERHEVLGARHLAG
jgi:mannose-1-phosphate guanylyltransferase